MNTQKTANYDKFPTKQINGKEGCALAGWAGIRAALAEALNKCGETPVMVVDCYPGVDTAGICEALGALFGGRVFISDTCAIASAVLDERLKDVLTDDRVFGHMANMHISECFDQEKLKDMEAAVQAAQGPVLVCGVGASLVCRGDILVAADIDRWEIQLRYRRGLSNWNTENGSAPVLTKYKRGYFAEWRWADKHKLPLLKEMDFFLDANNGDAPVLVTGEALRAGLRQLAAEPFRTVPYFDPGVWGGQWMKEVCGLDRESPNFAWSFDGVPEENAIRLDFGGVTAQLPAMNLVLMHPEALLGKQVYARFGAEFPIRFDFLDTMGGGNLSLQVHPLKEYIREQFGMPYTQDESYYFLDAEEDACVYLGIMTGAEPEALMAALRAAEKGEETFAAERFINRFPVKKHDHVLIPAGTMHCSGAGGMVLEISATPYIFTFKLWDWGRLGLDGLPRPIHLSHGEKNIQWERDTAWVQKNLLHREQILAEDAGYTVERTGLHELEFIETLRYTVSGRTSLLADGGVHMCNLVEGTEALICSETGVFKPFAVHYAETFILPAACGACTVEPAVKGETVKLLLATVRAE